MNIILEKSKYQNVLHVDIKEGFLVKKINPSKEDTKDLFMKRMSHLFDKMFEIIVEEPEIYECPECDKIVPYNSPACPHCGLALYWEWDPHFSVFYAIEDEE